MVTPDRIIDPGWVGIEGGRISGVGSGPPPPGAADLAGAWLLPGFIDLHMHGGGGHDVTASPDDLLAAVLFHRGHGTTRTLVSLMADHPAAMSAQLEWISDLTQSGVIAGVHLEGPFLAPARSGAQNVERLLPPHRKTLAQLISAGAGSVRVVTVAPELPGALPLIDTLSGSGVVAAVGHTEASYDEAVAGFAAGARLATHLFNAMTPIGHRAPGAAVAALDSGAFVELINDGVHVHPALVRLVAHSAPDRLAFVTDAASVAGAAEGTYTLGHQAVHLRDGQARLATSGALAGSTLTMDEALRRAVFSVGIGMCGASAALSGTPARVLDLHRETGSIVAGLAADLVVLDLKLCVKDVIVAGEYVKPFIDSTIAGPGIVSHVDGLGCAGSQSPG